MEALIQISKWVTANFGEVMGAFLMTLGAASIIARLTPTKADDKVIARILSFIHLLGLTKPEVKK